MCKGKSLILNSSNINPSSILACQPFTSPFDICWRVPFHQLISPLVPPTNIRKTRMKLTMWWETWRFHLHPMPFDIWKVQFHQHVFPLVPPTNVRITRIFNYHISIYKERLENFFYGTYIHPLPFDIWRVPFHKLESPSVLPTNIRKIGPRILLDNHVTLNYKILELFWTLFHPRLTFWWIMTWLGKTDKRSKSHRFVEKV